jgi:circadian clock protein KaiB
LTEPAPDDAPRAELDEGRYVLRLFVSGTTARSTRAIENLRRLCEEQLQGRYSLEVVDIYQHPEAARDNQVVAAPTLVKMLPDPVRRIVGDLADEERVLRGLNLSPLSLPGGRDDPADGTL